MSEANNDAGGAGKQTNPKDIVGSAKVPFSSLPWRVLWRVGLAMLEGVVKYGRHNYRVAGVRASVYFDAVVARHLSPWWEGEDIDPDSGFHHVDKAIAGLMVLRDSMLEGNFVDDRPPSGMRTGELNELNAEAARIIDKHKDKHPRHWTIADSTKPLETKSGKVVETGKWISWNGGPCPVPSDTYVDYRMREDSYSTDRRTLAGALRWSHSGFDGDIVEYMVHPL